MKKKILTLLIFCLAIINFGCSKGDAVSDNSTQAEQEVLSSNAAGSTQISGTGFFATDVECNSPGEGAQFAVKMTGDLEGCLFVFIDKYKCTPGGAYIEEGREYFVGTYNGQAGTFWTTYKFEAKYEGCNPDGSYLGAEILGRCQHPIVKESGTGVFTGVTGRIDMKDDIAAANYPYRGHLRF